MSLAVLVDAMKGASLNGVRLAVKDRERAREYWSQTVQRYNELMGYGLAGRDPVDYIYQQSWAQPSTSDRVELPVAIHTDGGTRLDELLVLATATRVLNPRKVFEIGTFMGRTTSVFVMNAPGGEIITLDLTTDGEPEQAESAGYIDTDRVLVKQRRVGSFLHDVGLDGRYTQLLADSMTFDPKPHAGTVDLGFIDGAHALPYVENDTRKMAAMMTDRGLVFWHDYGGKGRFRELTQYLDALARRIAIYRVRGTTLAWAPAAEVRKILPL